MTTQPTVSCICPTYGRYPKKAHLLESAVESFRRQDYPADRRQLMIVNDCPSQRLVCDVPGVLVLNLPERLPSLGDKYNAGVRASTGELLMSWEDDDVSLPHRIPASVRLLGDHDYYNPRAYWFSWLGRLTHEQNTGVAHNCAVFRRSAWEKVGGYPRTCKQDAGMDGLLRERCSVAPGSPLSAEHSWYVYRWGVSDHHVSAHADVEESYAEYGRRPVEPGVFRVKAAWEVDWVKAVYAALSRV